MKALIVDEASQAWSAEAFLFDKAYPNLSRVYLYGDDKQLPPVILATNARGDEQADLVAAGLNSLYDAAKVAGHPLHALRVQYRMPRVLADFVSRHFYDGNLVTPPGEKYDDLGAVCWCGQGSGRVSCAFSMVAPSAAAGRPQQPLPLRILLCSAPALISRFDLPTSCLA